MNKLGAVLAARIISELNELSVLVDRATHGLERAKKSGDDYYLDGVALNIHGFYSGLERIFERITIAEDKVVKYCMKNLEPFMVPKYVDFRIYGSKAKGTDIDGSGLDVMIILEDHSPSIESKIDDLIFDI